MVFFLAIRQIFLDILISCVFNPYLLECYFDEISSYKICKMDLVVFLTYFLIFSVIKLCYILIYIVSLIFSRSCEKEFKANILDELQMFFICLLVRAFAHDAIGRRIDPIELFLVPVSAPRLV